MPPLHHRGVESIQDDIILIFDFFYPSPANAYKKCWTYLQFFELT